MSFIEKLCVLWSIFCNKMDFIHQKSIYNSGQVHIKAFAEKPQENNQLFVERNSEIGNVDC